MNDLVQKYFYEKNCSYSQFVFCYWMYDDCGDVVVCVVVYCCVDLYGGVGGLDS